MGLRQLDPFASGLLQAVELAHLCYACLPLPTQLRFIGKEAQCFYGYLRPGLQEHVTEIADAAIFTREVL